ncbi:MAG: universal stress protein [Bryobacteraceae bacterium]|jgi:nucleotide-binding universal stress UspA family protein
MITFRRILFPVDFSARCASAVPSVQAMVKRFGSELTVLHVVDLPLAVGIAPPEAAAWATLIGADRLRENGKIALERFIAREFPGVRVKAESAEGDPATVIADYARDHGADLIMMPTSGLGPFRRFLLGSVTAKVLHDTTVPVWTGVHSEEIAAHPPDRWKRVLCALEDDARDLPVLQWAAAFASEQALELALVHAVRGPQECEGDPGFREFLFNVAQERIAKLQAQAGTNFEVCLRLGNAGPVVHKTATGHSADIVVIGRGVIQRPLGQLRSGAYEIIRDAPCPVISL